MMMDFPLTLRTMLIRARDYFPKTEVVTWTRAGIHRYTYREFYKRTCQLAHALSALGVKRGEKVGTVAWNSYRHLELYFGIPCMGGVLHTLNFRLPSEHLIYVINHAEDRVLFVEQDFLPIIEAIAPKLTTVRQYVIISDQPTVETKLPGAVMYDDLIARNPESYDWPLDIDEKEPAGMCFTSATTGNPKGVTYTHRGMVLHTMTVCMKDMIGIGESDVVLPLVPMFHVNAWGTPFASVWMGSKIVFPGAAMRDLPAIGKLVQDERVTLTAAVPTIWLGMLQVLAKMPLDLSSLREIVVGGSAAPRAMIEAYQKRFGIKILHAYGMTEATPLVTVCRLKPEMADQPEEKQYDVRSKQGRLAPGLEMRVVELGSGKDAPWDGKTIGELWLRGPWIADEYYQEERTKETFIDGWYHTGDVVTVDEDGYINILDRTKDVVKSGGEWISSVELENALMGMPGVVEASVVGIEHPKWDERPLAVVVPRPEEKENLTPESVKEFLGKQFPSWWVPDDVVFIEEIPKTSAMKFDKKVLRKQFAGHYGVRQI